MTTKAFLLFFLTLLPFSVFSQETAISNFIVKENLLKNYKIAIIAADKDDKPIESVNGTFVFSVNGFRQDLVFTGGAAVIPQQIEKSAFIYIKHSNEAGTASKLYYVRKKDGNLDPYKISWLVLLIVPLLLVFLAYLFKRFIIIAVIILAGLLYFNHNAGLNIPRFFETIFDGLKTLI